MKRFDASELLLRRSGVIYPVKILIWLEWVGVSTEPVFSIHSFLIMLYKASFHFDDISSEKMVEIL